jgi:hypothetical protein
MAYAAAATASFAPDEKRDSDPDMEKLQGKRQDVFNRARQIQLQMDCVRLCELRQRNRSMKEPWLYKIDKPKM